MKAESQGDQHTLNGKKMFVMDANVAHKLIVAARVGDAGVTLFLVDAKDPGVTCTKMPTIGVDNTCVAIFKDVQVSKDDVIGPVGEGCEILQKMAAKATAAKSPRWWAAAR